MKKKIVFSLLGLLILAGLSVSWYYLWFFNNLNIARQCCEETLRNSRPDEAAMIHVRNAISGLKRFPFADNRIALTYIDAAKIFFRGGKNAEAESCLDTAQHYMERTPSRYAQATQVHFAMGRLLYDRLRFQDAIPYLLNAVTLAEKAQTEAAYLNANDAYTLIIAAYNALGEIDKATDYVAQELEFRKQHQELISQIYINQYLAQGNEYLNVQKCDKAIVCFQRHLQLISALDAVAYMNTYLAFASAYMGNDNLAKSIEYYRLAERKLSEVKESALVLTALLYPMVNLAYKLEQWDSCITHGELLIKILGAKVVDYEHSVEIACILADSFRAKKNYVKAEMMFWQALQLGHKKFPENHFNFAYIYFLQGHLAYDEQKYREAIGNYEKAGAILAQLNSNDANIVTTQIALNIATAKAYAALHDFSLAVHYQQQALTIYRKMSHPNSAICRRMADLIHEWSAKTSTRR